MTRAALLLLALLAAALAAPLASGEHQFSHRVVIEGRVLDARGLPAPGLRPLVEASWPTHPCDEGERGLTDRTGDFTVCRHAHELPEDASVNVTVGNTSVSVAVDPLLRKAVVKMRLPEPGPHRDAVGERTYARTLRVEGRVVSWHDRETGLEGALVPATPRDGAPVEVRLVSGDAVVANGSAVTDLQGDYAVVLDVTDVPAGARVQVESEEKSAATDADGFFRRSDVDIIRDLRTAPPPSGRPGTETPPVPLPSPVLVVGLLAVTAWAWRRARGGAG